MKKISFFTVAVLLFQAVLCSCGFSQSAKTNSVKKPTNGVLICSIAEKGNKKMLIKNANVSLENIKTHLITTAKTDDKGRFKFAIPEGEYTLNIVAKNYKEYKQSFVKIKTDRTNNLELIELERDYTAEELIKMPVKEIIELMDNKFSVDKEIIQTLYYFHNYKKFPGLDFHFSYSESEDKYVIKEELKHGEIEIEAIQVNGKGKACYRNDKLITADLDYKTCTSIYGKMDCEPSNGAAVSGMMTALGYNETVNRVRFCVNFELNKKLEKLAIKTSGINGKVKYKDIISNNPKVKNIVIRKDVKPQKLTSKTMKDQILKGYWCTYDSKNNLVYSIKFKTKGYGNGYKLAETASYSVKNNLLIKDERPGLINYMVYKVEKKYLVFFEETLKTKYYYTYDKNKIISEKDQYTGQRIKFYQFDSIPGYSELKSYF